MDIDCHSSILPSESKTISTKKTKNLSIRGSNIAPSCEVVLVFLATYPSIQSVNIASSNAVRRKGTLSTRKKKARGALERVKVLDKLNIESNLNGFFKEICFFLCLIFSLVYTKLH